MKAEDDDADLIDPKKSAFVVVLGRKGSGKSHFSYEVVADWPGKVLVIDPTGDVAAELAKLGVAFLRIKTVPQKWPVDDEGNLVKVLLWHPDSASVSFITDVDKAFGLAYRTSGVLVFVDEVHTCCPGELIAKQPMLRRVLVEGRHRRVSLLACGPRPVFIAKLWLVQADHLILFKLPQEDDRKTVVKNLGFDPREVEMMHSGLRPYEHIWFNVVADRVTHYDPIPARSKPAIRHTPR